MCLEGISVDLVPCSQREGKGNRDTKRREVWEGFGYRGLVTLNRLTSS